MKKSYAESVLYVTSFEFFHVTNTPLHKKILYSQTANYSTVAEIFTRQENFPEKTFLERKIRFTLHVKLRVVFCNYCIVLLILQFDWLFFFAAENSQKTEILKIFNCLFFVLDRNVFQRKREDR